MAAIIRSTNVSYMFRLSKSSPKLAKPISMVSVANFFLSTTIEAIYEYKTTAVEEGDGDFRLPLHRFEL
ncbi:hypothetical protein L1887_38153 [Cichorium endivia]|nr:hypothetical protein L1887_38153 [Cichorium endivia]